MKKKIIQLVKHLVLLTASLVIGLLIGELIIRALYKEKINLFPRYTTGAEYGRYAIRKVRPNETYKHTSIDGVFRFKTNNRGFRNNYDVDYPKREGMIRVLSVGDSHTQGAEVNQEETFSYVCEQRLREAGFEAQVINTGVAGFSTAEALVLLENEGIKYDPDYVVLGFYANDYVDNLKADLFKLEGDSLIENDHEHLPGVKIQDAIYRWRIFKFLGENSYLYAYAFNTIWDAAKKILEERSQEKVETEYAVVNTDATDYEKALMRRLLNRMARFCHERGIKLIVLDIPIELSMKSSLDELIPQVAEEADTLFSTPALMPEFMTQSRVHLPHGHNHISVETHRLFAEKITDFILQDIQNQRNGNH